MARVVLTVTNYTDEAAPQQVGLLMKQLFPEVARAVGRPFIPEDVPFRIAPRWPEPDIWGLAALLHELGAITEIKPWSGSVDQISDATDPPEASVIHG